MKILIDGDACPVLEIVLNSAKIYDLDALIFADTCHQLRANYGEIIIVDKGSEAVDFAILSKCAPGDIILTNDYGLAALALAKKCFVLNFRGIEYTNDNIDRLLLERYLFKRARSKGRLQVKHSPRPKFEGNFKTNFEKFMENISNE